MLIPVLAMAIGIVLLMWSSDYFVEGAASLATRLGVSQMLIGMVIVGFGTSFPEMTVSALSAWEGASGIALGNAYGSNTANITLILGMAAVISPMLARSTIVRQEMPLLMAITALAVVHLNLDDTLTRLDGVLLLLAFAAAMYIMIRNEGKKDDAAPENNAPEGDALEKEVAGEIAEHAAGHREATLRRALFQVVAGLAVLIASSRALVWGAVATARHLGISDLVIGLTIVAVGTSLPELASSIAAARKNRDDIAIGNVIGSNLFNTLVVVGIAACVSPLTVAPELLSRDLPAMCFVTAVLFMVCLGRPGRPAVISRAKGAGLLALFAAYTVWVIRSA